MNIWLTGALMLFFALIAGWCHWREGRLLETKPSLISPTLVFYFSLIALIILSIHMVEHIIGQPIPSAWERGGR